MQTDHKRGMGSWKGKSLHKGKFKEKYRLGICSPKGEQEGQIYVCQADGVLTSQKTRFSS
jgi:hypothetical protein